MSETFRENAQAHRLELDVDGGIVFADYERREGSLLIFHVEAPRPLRGTGAADRLMRHIADLASSEGRSITPYCGYAAAWLRRHRPRTG